MKMKQQGDSAWRAQVHSLVVSKAPCTRRKPSLALLGPVLGALDEASVVGHDFMLWQMKGKFQGHQHWKFKGNQLSPVQSELLFQFLQRQQNRFSAAVNNLGFVGFDFSRCYFSTIKRVFMGMHLLSLAVTEHQKLVTLKEERFWRPGSCIR